MPFFINKYISPKNPDSYEKKHGIKPVDAFVNDVVHLLSDYQPKVVEKDG
jgi:hypothetical protein